MAQPASSNFFLDNDDLRFQLSIMDWDTLVDLQEQLFLDEDRLQSGADGRAFYEEILGALGEFIARDVAPYEHELDHEHPTITDGEVAHGARMDKVLAGLAALGAMGVTLPRRLGGMNCPIAVSNVIIEMLTRADAGVAGTWGFYGGIASALQLYSAEEGTTTYENGRPTKTRFDDVIRRMGEGVDWGAMVLTEPQAGSDLARIRSKALQQHDGSWRLTGQKIYITAGHGDHHVVIARTEDEGTHPGLKGLSLFYVPRFVDAAGKGCPRDTEGSRSNFIVGGIEHKLGQHAAVAATIHYEESHAELIGARGEGFKLMLVLMNNARISVAFEALGTCEAAYRTARAYAEERVTMGKPIARHEMIADYLDEMDICIRGLRAITFEAAYHEEVATRLRLLLKVKPPANADERKRLEKQQRRSARRSRALTPLIKYQGGEEAVRQARMAMQIQGGLGYIVETGTEKLLRDALIIPVYEGTSQIQALMALKDNLGAAIKNPSRFAGQLAEARLESLRADDLLEKGAARMRYSALSAQQTIISRIAADKFGKVSKGPLSTWMTAFSKEWDPAEDFSFGMLNAERLTKLLTWAMTAEVLVAQAKQVAGTAHAEERRQIAQRFIERFEPRMVGVVAEIDATSGSLLDHLRGKAKKSSSSSSSSSTARAAE
jgi:alkylation response protein AidB-like acyl-CoA dehydrogenase